MSREQKKIGRAPKRPARTSGVRLALLDAADPYPCDVLALAADRLRLPRRFDLSYHQNALLHGQTELP